MIKLRFVDVGAANFELEKRWSLVEHEIELILFEPDNRSYARLQLDAGRKYNCALGSDPGNKTLNLTKKPECSSFLTPNMSYLRRFPDPERWKIQDRVEVEVKTLDSFHLDVEFMKLDTQGSELDILKGATRTLDAVLGLQIEVSFLEIYTAQPLFGDIQKFLSEYGFEFFDFITEYRYGRQELNRKGQLAFADALFLKPPEVVSDMGEEKRSNYIKIVRAYGKNDLAVCMADKP